MTATMVITAQTTTTVASSPPIPSNSSQLSVNTPTTESYIERLVTILEKFEFWQDALSKKMFNWGDAILQRAFTHISNLNAFKPEAINRINTLVSEILIYPLDSSPLVEPYIVNERILEKRDLDICVANGNKSPFDGSPLTYTAHLFAIEMLSWVRSLPNEILPKEMAAKSVVEAPSTALISMFQPTSLVAVPSNTSSLASIVMLAQQSINLEKLNGRLVQIQLETNALNAAKAALEAKAKQATAELQKSANEHKEAITKQVDSLQQTQQNNTNALEARLGDMSSRVNTLQSQLNSSNAVIANQNSQIQNCRSEIAELNRRVKEVDKGGGDSCVIL